MAKKFIVLKNKVLNYVFIDKTDDMDKYRVTIELTAEDIAALNNLLAEDKKLKDYGKLDLVPGDSITPKTSFVPLAGGGELYSGAVGDVALYLYEYSYKKRQGVSFGLIGVYKRKDGERLDSRLTLKDVFGDVDEPF